MLGSLIVGGRLGWLARRSRQLPEALIGLSVGPLGVLSAGLMWLAFIPPQRYLDWVLAHAGTEA